MGCPSSCCTGKPWRERTSMRCLSFYNTRLASLDHWQGAQTLEIYNCTESFKKSWGGIWSLVVVVVIKELDLREEAAQNWNVFCRKSSLHTFNVKQKHWNNLSSRELVSAIDAHQEHILNLISCVSLYSITSFFCTVKSEANADMPLLYSQFLMALPCIRL